MSDSDKKDKKKYGEYYWIDPKTKLGYAKIWVPTGEFKADGSPKYKPVTKRAKNKTHADQLAKEMKRDYEVRKTGFVEGERMNFNQAADWYIENKAVPPVFSNEGTLIVGMITYISVRQRIERMKKFFGKMLIKNIDEDTLYRYKKFREKDNVLPATINRDFEDLRAMFRTFVRRRWIRESPFDFGEKVIEKALERRRDVTLTTEQEFVLLEIAKKSEKSRLYFVMLCLLDTGARPSEIYDAATYKGEPVIWKSFFDYNFKAVKLISYKGRKRQVRFAPVTDRLEDALMSLWDSLKPEEKNLESQIFPITSFKTSWATVRREAYFAFQIAGKLEVPVRRIFDNSIDTELLDETRKEVISEWKKFEKSEDFIKPFIMTIRLRDFRRHWSSHLAKLGVEGDLRQKVLGHEQRQTTFDYTHADLGAIALVKELMDKSLKVDEVQDMGEGKPN